MLEALTHSLVTLFAFEHMLYLLLGTTLGFFIGLLPGLGGIVGLSLMLPFIYGMDPISAFALLVGLLAVLPTSDTFASVLMGIPGSAASQATVLDGFALSKRGEAARALSAAFSASLVGGLFGAAILTVLVIAARPLILSFGSSELFAMTLFGLSMVGVLSGSSLAKGIGACALGLVFGSIGAAPATGEYRMDFGSIYLGDGIPLIVVALAVFALPEIVDLIRKNQAISGSGHMGTGFMRGVRDTIANWWLVLRCSGIGAIVGVIPGLGNSVVDWISYGHAVQTSRDKSEFGKGDIRGVIAPESANNSTTGGGLFPTLLFGIPGSGAMAIFLAGMVLLGVQPGPSMADPNKNLHLTYTAVWSLALANVFGTIMCIIFAPLISRITTIRYTIIAPFMILIITFAAFQSTRSLYDLVALVGVGLIGIMLRRFGWPRPAFLVGFVLATQLETYFYHAVQFHGTGFLLKPMPLLIIGLSVISVWVAIRKRPEGATGRIETEGSGAGSAAAGSMLPQLLFTSLIAIALAFAIYEGAQRSFLGGIFPILAGAAGLLAVVWVLIPQARNSLGSNVNYDTEANSGEVSMWPILTWFAALIIGVALVGFVISITLFFIFFCRKISKLSWPMSLVLTAAAIAGMLVLANALNLVFPGGVLQNMYNLPWPLR
ncbi:membrane protein [Nitratireductor aestuarii]|uniref:Membrane protein n=1 Tax=Nitratireductor aestuarii TaxID=1735103 RepID=A0A916W5T2_9HYPH|nr:tripartite tricarboxylate transporter permease [Nitratireductor aestuarii]GGA68997.1 membrane protein [Nitratireductor aestuarii]